MKQFYFSLFLFISFNLFLGAQTFPTGNSTEVGITSGELSVSLSGAANYTIPITVPPGISAIVPKISLTYSSQGGNGVAGYGWNIAGVSTISRIPATKYHDGIIDPVDFDSYDRFALDGQRLIVKAGSAANYGGNGTEYNTESFSNVKITSHGVHPDGSKFGPSYFLVQYPDGSKAYYGNSTDSRSITDWSITYWENPQGVRISYSYVLTYNILDVASIKYGTLSTTTPINEIKFNYGPRSRYEDGYIGGLSLLRTKMLTSINVIGNGSGFRNYFLEYDKTSLEYDRLIRITEKNGDNSKSYNPTLFDYGSSIETFTVNPKASSLGMGEINSNNSATVAGDFDGDGKMDFVLYPTTGGINANKDFWLFKDVNNSASLTPTKVNCGYFTSIFPSNGLAANGKMYHYQGVTIAQGDLIDLNSTNFKTYSNLSMGVALDYVKKAVFPERWIQNCNDSFNAGQGKFFFNGDFNGDGLTDVMALDMDLQELVCEPDPYGGPDLFNYSISSTSQFYFVDLDRRKTTNFVNYAGILQDYFLSTDSKIETFDVNGDGKTDILHFKNGKVYVYTLNKDNQLEFLFKKLDSDIKITQSILSGDYNGDGKMDFIIPTSTGLYATSYVKFLSTGTGFVKSAETYPFVNKGNYTIGQDVYTCNLIPLDINIDGKTDIVQCISVYGKAFDGARVLMSVFKNTNSTFTASSTYDTGASQAIRSYPLPVFLSPKTNNQYLSLGVISNNQIYTFDSKNDCSKEGLIVNITTGNGVKETITYSPLQQDPYEPFYTPASFTETFPNIDIVAAPSIKIVTMLENQSKGGYKKQLLHYAGAVSNVEGVGFLGFRSLMRTNWYNDSTALISNVSKNDISLRGTNIENFSLLGYYGPTTETPLSFISRSEKKYNTAIDALQSNKVFKLKNTSDSQFNGLDGTSSVTTTVLDQYNNPTLVTSLLKEGGSTIQTNTTTIKYKTVNASPYYIGVPESKTISSVVTGSTMASEEKFGYTSTNYGLLNKIEKKGDATTNYITEDNVYDGFGNITKKTITANGLTSRITSYVYDISGRFLTKTTDIEGLSKTFDYNLSSGVLNSETNQNGLITSYLYDSWCKKTKTTDYLGKSNIYTYTRIAEKNTITNAGDDGSSVEETFDDLGRKIKIKIKDVAGNFSSVDYLYDIYDRNYKTSEPYLGTSPTLFSVTNYDDYGRPKEITAYTGKTTDIKYAGLSTTVSDYLKTKISVRNVMGKVVSMTDTPGGNITYTYYANGNLKETDYGGVITKITQDGWGRKTELTDPSAGTYKYEYNDLGELTKETTPNGYTTYKLNDFGKLDEKQIVAVTGDNISTTKYTYDSATKLLLKKEFNDLENSTQTTDVYTYDTSKRINKTVETTPFATFTKDFTYDAFGRVDTETYTASAGGKSSSRKIQNTYQNGSHWQILDALTSYVLWETNSVNAKGQVLTAVNGPLSISNAYDTKGYVSQFKYDLAATPTTNVLTLDTDFDALSGNLKTRTNSLFSRNEAFNYDNLDRLTKYTNALGMQETQAYDDRGRITQNNIGTYEYDGANTYQNKAITPTHEALGYYSNREGVYNDSMEDRTGWATGPYNPQCISFDNTKSYSGKNSVKINTAASGVTVSYVQSDVSIPINNTVDTQYTFSGWVYSDSPTAQLTLFQYNANETGYYSYVNSASTTTLSTWVPIEMTVMVPASVKSLRLRLDVVGSGNVWFDDVKIRKTSDAATAARALNVTYNTFKNPIQIEETGVDKISFTYNDGNDRSSIFYGGLQTDKLSRSYQKHYSADGIMEVKQNTVTGEVEFLTYIGGDGYSAPLVLKSNGTAQNYLYLLRDYQGSILAIADQAGIVVEKRLFDAWGNIITVQDAAGNTLPGLTVLNRGYTGHEHLQSVGIIHMNGRLYDPKLHRFMQPDNFVQDPFNTQNYNRYGYCWNNPLRYTDPSGEWIHIVIGAVIGGVVNWGTHGFRMDMEGLKAFGIGAGAGAIGAATGGAAFGLAGGAAAGGGGFFAGAVSGAVGATYSSMFLSIGNNVAFGDPLMSGKELLMGVAIGAVTGGVFNGVTALAAGKTFWTGTTPRVAVQPITLPQTAGLSEVDNGNNIKTGDYKISSSTRATTAPTNSTNSSKNISIDNGYVDVSKNPAFNKLPLYEAEIMPQYSSSTLDNATSLTMAQKGTHIFDGTLHPKPYLDVIANDMGGRANLIHSALEQGNGFFPSSGQFQLDFTAGGVNMIMRGFVNKGIPIINTIYDPLF